MMEKVTPSANLAVEPAGNPVPVTTVQPVPMNYFLAIAISVVLTFMLGGAFGTVVMFASMMARQAVPDQTASANKIQTADVVVVVQTATPSAAQAAVVQPDSATIESQPLPVADAKALTNGARDFARLGDAAAPVQLVIFADAQCPFCKQTALETEPQLIAQYVKTGKASLVYRHYTFLGTESDQIAIAMECAGEQSKFWEFHKQVFENQQPENAGLANEALMLNWARAVGLDTNTFKTCLSDPAMKARVQADTEVGGKLGVRGTPTMFINGSPYPGAIPFTSLQSTIDAALTAVKP